MSFNIIVKIIYINNTCRETLGEFIFSSNSREDFLPFVYESLEKTGYPFNTDKGKLYFFDSEKNLISEETLDFLLNHERIELIYSEVIAPYASANVDEYNGLIFFFHPNESTHQGRPHIHVKYSGEEIKFDIMTAQKIEGRFKSPKKENIAKSRVRNRQNYFLEKWYELVKINIKQK